MRLQVILQYYNCWLKLVQCDGVCLLGELILPMFTVAPSDYVALSTILIFAPCETQRCVDVAIVDDMIAEQMESFVVTLQRTPDLDSRITFNRAAGAIEIINNDG